MTAFDKGDLRQPAKHACLRWETGRDLTSSPGWLPAGLDLRPQAVTRLQSAAGNRALAGVLPLPAPVQRIKAELSADNSSLRIDPDPPIAVAPLETFIGAPGEGSFTWGKSRQYVVLKEPESDRRWVFDRLTSDVLEYGVFMNSQSWRAAGEGNSTRSPRYKEMSEKGAVPASTALLPLKYYKLIDIKHFPSIRATGLSANAEQVYMSGFSAGTTYAARDAAIAAASWLGTTMDPGEAMKPAEMTRFFITITVPTGFRDAYLRSSHAVLHPERDREQEGTSGTALCFSPVPPDYISVADAQFDEMYAWAEKQGGYVKSDADKMLRLKGLPLTAWPENSRDASGSFMRIFDRFAERPVEWKE